MAHEDNLKTISIPANADLSAAQYLFVNVNSSGNIVTASAGLRAVGILQDKPNAAGVAGCVAVGGVSKCVASEAIAAGSAVSVASGGKAQVAASGEFVVGQALTAASGDGGIFSMLINFSSPPPT